MRDGARPVPAPGGDQLAVRAPHVPAPVLVDDEVSRHGCVAACGGPVGRHLLRVLVRARCGGGRHRPHGGRQRGHTQSRRRPADQPLHRHPCTRVCSLRAGTPPVALPVRVGRCTRRVGARAQDGGPDLVGFACRCEVVKGARDGRGPRPRDVSPGRICRGVVRPAVVVAPARPAGRTVAGGGRDRVGVAPRPGRCRASRGPAAAGEPAGSAAHPAGPVRRTAPVSGGGV